MKNSLCLAFIAIALFLGGCFDGLSKTIPLIEVKGFISNEMAEGIIGKLDDLRKKDDFKVVLLRINSPGGAVAASQEIFEAVKRLNEKKPVIVSMGTVAASGGYQIACGGSKIFANPGTVTGSIGVRLDHMYAGELIKMLGLGHETLKSGALKNLSPIDRPLSPKEKVVLKDLIDELRNQFVESVASSRNLSLEKVNKIADGRIYSGAKAKELGLIDELGGMQAAITEAAKMAGIKGDPKIYKIKKKGNWIVQLLKETQRAIFNSENKRPLYIWR